VIEDLTSVAADSERIIMLGGYAAKRCAVRTHNDFAPLVPVPEGLLDEFGQMTAECSR
jgi:hypothetical protein